MADNKDKTRVWDLFEICLLVVVCAVVGLRATYTETPDLSAISPMANFMDAANSVVLSGVLFFFFAVWVILWVWKSGERFRGWIFLLPIFVFWIGAAVSFWAASNKRAAITDILTLSGPLVMAMLLMQLLRDKIRIKTLMVVIVSLGAVMCCQCVDQVTSGNEMLVEDYEREPAVQLERLGIEEGSFQHFLYEHRLYSGDVRGFFTTGNSAGSFMLLTFFAGLGLLADQIRSRVDNDPSRSARIVITGIVGCASLLGLGLTHSKGAILGCVVGGSMFGAWYFFGRMIARYRWKIFITAVIGGVLCAGAVLMYGVRNGRLPGGNSMLVRWQYWDATAEMIGDYPATGVGAGNFSSYYTRYKNPAAPETVRDPHNFVLALLAEYGPLGLAGFGGFSVVILLLAIKRKGGDSEPVLRDEGKVHSRLVMGTVGVVCLLFLTVRPVLLDAELGNMPEVQLYLIFYWYLIPLAVFAGAGAALHWATRNFVPGACSRAALFAGVVGFLLHNLIDFAIFEPGVMTLFGAVLAVLTALCFGDGDFAQAKIAETRGIGLRLGITVLVCAVAGGVYFFGVGPTVECSVLKERAAEAAKELGQREQLLLRLGPGFESGGRKILALNRVDALLNKAADADVLDPAPLNLHGRILMHAGQMQVVGADRVERAVGYYNEAIKRDEADFKNYENLAKVYLLLDSFDGDEDAELQKAALANLLEACARYPASGRLHYQIGQVSSKLAEMTDEQEYRRQAVDHYHRAVEIEQAFREQFKIMYPDEQLVSRLGEAEYENAMRQINGDER